MSSHQRYVPRPELILSMPWTAEAVAELDRRGEFQIVSGCANLSRHLRILCGENSVIATWTITRLYLNRWHEFDLRVAWELVQWFIRPDEPAAQIEGLEQFRVSREVFSVRDLKTLSGEPLPSEKLSITLSKRGNLVSEDSGFAMSQVEWAAK